MMLRLAMLSSSRLISSFNDSKIGSSIEARIGRLVLEGTRVSCWLHGLFVLDASSSVSVEDDRSEISLWVAAVVVAALAASLFSLSTRRGASVLPSSK